MASRAQTSRAAPGAAPLSGDAAARRRGGVRRAAGRGARAPATSRPCCCAWPTPTSARRSTASRRWPPSCRAKTRRCCIDGHADLVARAGADGAHLTGIEAFSAALEQLKPDRIVGAGGLATRHDAMARGRSRRRLRDVRRAGRRRRAAEPSRRSTSASPGGRKCSRRLASAMPAALDEVAPLVEAGADFVALGDWLWRDAAAIARNGCARRRARLRLPESAA